MTALERHPEWRVCKSRWRYLVAACLCILVCCVYAQTPPKIAKSEVRIILVGDSTVAVQSGWGPGFCALLPPRVECINLARSGRSSLSYRSEGAWDHVLDVLKQDPTYKASYVLIQFGHNDQPGKPGRSTDVTTEFPANLTRFVVEVRSAGAKPVLITPLERRIFQNGKLANGLFAWADATRRVAATEHVPLIDLNAMSYTAMQTMGLPEADTLAMAPPPPEAIAGEATGNSATLPKSHAPGAPELLPDGTDPNFKAAFDYTHLGRKGSAYFGQMVFVRLQKFVPELEPYLVQSPEKHDR